MLDDTLRPAPPRRGGWAAPAALVSVTLAAIAGFLFLMTVTGGLLRWSPLPPGSPADTSGRVSLPVEVGAPGIWTPDATAHPIPAAAVLISGNTWYADDSTFYGGLVGAGADDYRVLDNEGAAGMASVLSPDGRRLASGDGILDIADGRRTPYPRAWTDLQIAAQAWSPDGTRLVVTSRPVDDEPYAAPESLALLATGTGAITELEGSSPGLDGWTAAFSPDGARLAYPAGGRIRILTLASGAVTEIPMPDGAMLAGKGGWTRDGRGLLVVAGERCDTCGDYPISWTVTTLSASTGAVAGPQYRLDGIYAVRVLGWWPSGRPVAVAYAPAPGATATLFDDPGTRADLSGLTTVGTVRVLELTPGSDHAELAAAATESIDVADNVLAAGTLRDGRRPLTSVDRLATGVAWFVGLTAAAALLTGAYAAAQRASRRRLLSDGLPGSVV
ncbi:hypothetical protein AB0C07_09505 [Actinoplanes missouriensis]|uniref:hypothetical protein n=1 Tax=Actinoplanes missouriensis TaxID=1866 RepID=UPI0033D96FFC